MLNYYEILERRKKIPEPKEVTEARELILSSFKDLQFFEDEHKYLINRNGKDYELPSVSSIIHQFEPETDWDDVKKKYAEKNGLTVEQVTKSWHENNIISTTRGSITHFWGENAMNLMLGYKDKVKENMPMHFTKDGYLIPYSKKEEAIEQYYTDILMNEHVFPVIPEAKVYTNLNDMFNFKIEYAGTFDILLAYRYKGEIVFAINDFKTNKSLYSEFNRKNNIILKEPFDKLNLIAEPLSNYTLQLSLYQLALMQLGLKVVDRKLIWLKDDGTYEKIQTKDVTKELIEVLS